MLNPDNNKPWWGQQVRDYFAKQLDGVEGVHQLMNYTSDGKPDPVAYPYIRFRGGNKSFSIVGIGDYGTELIMRHIPDFTKMTDKAVPIRMLAPDIAITHSGYPLSYTVHGFVPGVKPKQRDLLMDNQVESKRWLAQVIANGIKRQCEAINISHVFSSVSVLDYTMFAPITKDNAGKAFAPQVRAEFTINARLIGDWAVGRYIGRGQGRITQSRRPCKQVIKEAA
jgi:hypothetical protein